MQGLTAPYFGFQVWSDIQNYPNVVHSVSLLERNL